MMIRYSRNISRLYVIKISKWFNLVMPVVVLFYQDNGMGMQDIFVLKSIYSLAIVVLELPSGWMADVWGRKQTLILGAILGCAGFLMYSFSFGFWAFALAEIVLGAGHSFVSGADSSMLYESLKEDDKAGQYVKHEGRMISAGNFAEALAGIAAGFLASVSLRTPFYFQFIIAAMAIPAAITLIDIRRQYTTNRHTLKQMAADVKTTLTTNKDLRISIMLSSITGTATLTFAWLVQPFFKSIGLGIEWFGIMWTALNLSVGVSSAMAYTVAGKSSKRIEVLTILCILASGYILSGVAITGTGIFFLFLFYLARGMATPIFKNYINESAPDRIRSTILSVRNLIIRIIFVAVGPMLGWITDTYSLNSAFIITGILYLLTTLIVVLPWLTNKPGKEK